LGIIFDFEDRLRELKFTLLGRGSWLKTEVI
jgi:hypothetical protein